MYLVNLRFGWKLWWSVLFSIMLVVGWTITSSQADHCKGKHKKDDGCNSGGGGGGGKPPKDDPPPPEDFNPVIATWGEHKGKGRVSGIIMVMEADGSTKQVVVDTSDGLFDVARGAIWSPDGSRIAFWGGSGFSRGYYITEMEMDASVWTGGWHSPELLVDLGGGGFPSHAPLDWHPRPDPGQHTIALSAGPSFSGENIPDIFVVDFEMTDGIIVGRSEFINITDTPNSLEFSPTWSPNGEQIAYFVQGYPSPDEIEIYDVKLGSPFNVELPLGSPLKGAFISDVAWANGHNLLAVTASDDIWCVDINNLDGVSVFNLTANFNPSEDILERSGVSWTAGDTGIIYGTVGGDLYVLEFDLPGDGCPTNVVNYQDTATRRVMTDSRFTSADWWRNALCGDANLDAGEQCDDGNRVDGDSCSALCMLES